MTLHLGGGLKLLDRIKALQRAMRRGEEVAVAQIAELANACLKRSRFNNPSPETVAKWKRLLHEACVQCEAQKEGKFDALAEIEGVKAVVNLIEVPTAAR